MKKIHLKIKKNVNLEIFFIKTEISQWLVESHKQVFNITNLSLAITQYQEVIERLYNNYKKKIMGLTEYLAQKKNKLETIQTMQEIVREYQVFRKEETLKPFLEQIVNRLKKDFKNFGWEVIIKNRLWSGKKWYFPLRIQQSETAEVLFGFEYRQDDFYDLAWGIVRRNNGVDFEELKKNKNIENKLGQVKNPLGEKNNDWWLQWGCYNKGDLLYKIIQEDGVEKAVEGFIKQFMGIFKSCECIIIRCNEILEQKK